MNIVRLRATDLFAYAHLDQPLKDLGLVLVTGENGAGKTSLFKAITWTLFEDTLCKQRGDEVIRIDAITRQPILGKTCGIVELEVDGKQVEVRRYRQHQQHKNKLLLFVDGKEITGPTNRDTQQRIEQILQLDAVAFRSVAMFPQGAAGFAEGTDAQQKAILETVLSLERFSAAHQAKKVVAAKLQADISAEQAKLDNAQLRLDDQTQEIANLRDKQSGFAAWKQSAAAEAQQKLADTQAQRPPVDETIETRMAELAAEVEQARNAQTVIDRATSSVQSLTGKLGRLQGQLETNAKTLAEAPGPEPEKMEFDTRHYGEQAEACRQDMLRQKAQTETLAHQISHAEAAVSRRENTTHCDRCGQALTDTAKGKLFGDLGSNLKELRGQLEGLQQGYGAHRIAYESCQKSYDLARAWEEWDNYRKAWEGASAQALDLERQVAEVQAEIARFQHVLDKARSMAQDASAAQTQYYTLQRQQDAQRAAQAAWQASVSTAVATLAEIEGRECPYTAILGGMEQKSQQIASELSAHRSQAAFLGKELEHAAYLVQAYSRSGMPSLLLDTVVPELNDRANEYLDHLCDGMASVNFSTQTELKSGETREKFEVSVEYSEGCDSYRGISGGERRRADVAILLALGDISASRATAPVRIRLLDEPFDNLDAEGRERVVRLLKEVVLPRTGTLLVMTHDEDLKSWFDTQITIAKNSGIATIVA